MAGGKHERRGSRGASCTECGAPLAGDQRYCLDCGARRESGLPPAVAVLIDTFRDRDRGNGAAAAAVPADGREAEGKVAGVAAGAAVAGAAGAKAGTTAGAKASTKAAESGLLAYIPSPRAAAALVICMVGLGTIVGAATSQVARSAGAETIILDIAEEKKPPPEEEAPELAVAPPEEEAEAPEPEASVTPPLPEEPLPEIPEEPLPEEPLPEEPVEEPPPIEEPELEEFVEEQLPEVKHLFLIVLGENGFEETFGLTSSAPYLSQTLPEQGELLTNYYAVTSGKLANGVALLSGQGPTPETATECPPTEVAPLPTDIVPGTISSEGGQVEGAGCLYPKEVETLPGQLSAAKLKWKVYVEEAIPGTPEPKVCPRPFADLHSLADTPDCLAATAPLSKLVTDLKAEGKTPTLSYIVPNACHLGATNPCEPGGPVGPAAAEPFLRQVVPEIVKSPAYEEAGLLVITSAQAPQIAPVVPEGTPPPAFVPDTSSCCGTPAYPNLPPLPEEAVTGPVKATGGGGHVGMLLLSKYVAPGTVNETTYANHFTLLATIEELFGLEKLGYAAEPVVLPFDSSVFNFAKAAEEEEQSTSLEEEAGEPAP